MTRVQQKMTGVANTAVHQNGECPSSSLRCHCPGSNHSRRRKCRADDLVGAFINGELRGEGDIIDFDGGTYVSMTVYLAGGEETISFTLFNAAECATVQMDGTHPHGLW